MIKTIFGEFKWVTAGSIQYLLPIDDVGFGDTLAVVAHEKMYVYENPDSYVQTFVPEVPGEDKKLTILAFLIARGDIDPIDWLVQE